MTSLALMNRLVFSQARVVGCSGGDTPGISTVWNYNGTHRHRDFQILKVKFLEEAI